MTGFKVGDIVVCIADSIQGEAFNVPLSMEFTITQVSSGTIKLEGYRMAYLPDRFVHILLDLLTTLEW